MSTPRQIRVLCIDDHALVREGMAALINRQPDMIVVGESATGADGIDVFRSRRPDVTLVDLRLPDINGVDVIAALVDHDPRARILVVSSSEGDVDITRALAAGAHGYVLKGMPREQLLDGIRQVQAGFKWIPAEVGSKLAEHLTDEPLTRRELEVLTSMASGARNKEIADALGVSEETVKMHVKSIIAKLDAEDRTGAVTTAIKRGVLHL
jgi:DNA-binding NarL/FixJ family response regulator